MIVLARTAAVLDAALERRAYSAVTAEVGTRSQAVWKHASGRIAYDHASHVTHDTIFDLASLTKVISTTTLALELVVSAELDLSTPVADLLPTWSGRDRASVTVRDLFEHSSGLTAYRPYFRSAKGRAAFERAMSQEPLEYAPRSASVYSDLGFILLGFILEDVGRRSLDEQSRAWRASAGIQAPLGFRIASRGHDGVAFTENDPWRGRLLQGEVHDENAAALGGVAGHAGLFGTAAAVGEFARWWLALLTDASAEGNTRERVARSFVTRSRVPGSSRAIGWDTMLPTSSCGSRLSSRAIGHTGFTGTSVWLDPARDLYAVLLTNRVHPTRNNDQIQQVRRDFHDAVVKDLDERDAAYATDA